MPQFSRGVTRPISPRSYRTAARRLREIADAIEGRAEPVTPRDRASLTSAINGLVHFVRALADRHHGRARGNPRRPGEDHDAG